MRTLVQTQQTQIKTLQSLEQAQPLVGFTTDSPWGMALEGLVLGLVALALGVASMLGSRIPRGRKPMQAPQTPAPRPAVATDFSDSLLYLAHQDDAQDSLPPVTTHLHDPQQDAAAATLAHEDGDSELEYHRMALTAQGLSVTAGAGHVDSERLPLDTTQSVPAAGKAADHTFSPQLSRAEFDQRAAAEEVERVRRYLAQRRADRALGQAALAAPPTVANPAEPGPDSPAAGRAGARALDIDLDLFASPPVPGKAVEVPAANDLDFDLDLHLDSAPVPLGEVGVLEWGASPFSSTAPAAEEPPLPEVEHLPPGHVQLALAREFMDLGLWEEARARMLEILEQPDVGQHAPAQALLEELAATASAPLDASADPESLLP